MAGRNIIGDGRRCADTAMGRITPLSNGVATRKTEYLPYLARRADNVRSADNYNRKHIHNNDRTVLDK